MQWSSIMRGRNSQNPNMQPPEKDYPHSMIDRHKSRIMDARYLMQRMSLTEQADRVAHHYLANCASARSLFEMTDCLLRFRMRPEQKPEVEKAIEYIYEQIRAQHAYDLGLELEWKPPQPIKYLF